MSVSHVRDSFNAAADGKANADRVLLSYVRKHDVEYQVIHFQGTYADGSAMNFSRDCKPGTDPVSEAATAAEDAIRQKEPPNETSIP